jgi:large repetitive protein
MKRFALVAAFAAVVAGVVVMPGSSASFNDSDPCPADGALLVCPKAHVGQPYSLQLLAKAGCDLYRWEVTNGSLPAGLTMSSSGLVTGTPTASGPTQPWVTVHDLLPSEGGYPWCGGDNQSQRQFVFTAVPGLSIQNQSVPGGTMGQPYSVTFTALSVTNTNPVQGSPADATWSVQSGNLPAGVTLSSQGVLSGTPTSEGSYQFVVKAVGGSDTSDTETETLVVRQPIAVSSPFATGTAPKAEVSVPLSVAQTATGGAGTFTWSVSEGTLPAGVVLNPDGTLSGTPTVPGRFAFVMSAKDQEDRTAKVNATLVVSPKLTIRTLRLKAAKVKRPYRFKVATLGGVAPTTWTVVGKLPKGVKFAPRIGTLLGVPRKAGKYRLTFEAVDSLDVTATKTLTLKVVK